MNITNYKGRLLKIAIPILLSNLISQLQMLIDRMFLGRLDISAMSAVGNVSSPVWTTMALVNVLAVGAAIIISQAIGEGDRKKAQDTVNSLFKYSNCFAVVLFIVWCVFPRHIFRLMRVDSSILDMSVSYIRICSPSFLLVGMASAVVTLLQVSEKTNVLIVYGVVRSVINIILDYGLVFGNLGMPRMEVAGAALATTIAEFIGSFIVLWYVIQAKNIPLKPSLAGIFNAKVTPYLSSIKLGIPAALEDFCWNIGHLFLIVMLNQISVSAAGVYSIIFGMELIPVAIIGALGSAALTLSGQETGRGNLKGIRDIIRISLSWCLLNSVIVLFFLLLFPRAICGLFTTDATIIAASKMYLLIVGIDLFPKAMNMIIGSGIKGYGNTKWMLFTQMIGTAFVILGSAMLVLGFKQGIIALCCLTVADETLRCIINIFKFKHIVSGSDRVATIIE